MTKEARQASESPATHIHIIDAAGGGHLVLADIGGGCSIAIVTQRGLRILVELDRDGVRQVAEWAERAIRAAREDPRGS